MGLETGTTIASLNSAWPLGTDPRSQGDDHLRLVKAAVKNDAVSKAVGGVQTIASMLQISNIAPVLWLHDTDVPAAGTRLANASGNFRLQAADAAGASTADVVVANATVFQTLPLTQLASTGGIVEVGNTGTSSIAFKRNTGNLLNTLTIPDGAILRVQNASGVAWASISAAAGWAPGSDARMKENIEPIPYGLATVLALRPVVFNWIDGGKRDIGLLAHEVQTHVPEVVEEMPGEEGDEEGAPGMFTLRKDALVAVLIKAVQELNLRLEALEA